MLWPDWLILGIVALSALISLIRGFVVEALSIVVWVAALWIAFRYTAPFAELALGNIEVPSLRLASAATVLIVAVVLFGSLLSWLAGRLVRASGLSGTDRLLGTLFGAARGLLTVTALVAVASWTPLCADPWWQRSQLIPMIESLAIAGRDFLPENLREMIGSCRAPLPAEAPPAPLKPSS